jgi:hypothetical protein
MNINATILFQAFNFFIVYWMLRLLLFKPVVAIIEHENAQEATLRNTIDEQKKNLEIQEKERQKNWVICQEYFNTHQPDLSQKKHSLAETMEYDTEINPLPDSVVTETIMSVRQALEEKIKHVH